MDIERSKLSSLLELKNKTLKSIKNTDGDYNFLKNKIHNDKMVLSELEEDYGKFKKERTTLLNQLDDKTKSQIPDIIKDSSNNNTLDEVNEIIMMGKSQQKNIIKILETEIKELEKLGQKWPEDAIKLKRLINKKENELEKEKLGLEKFETKFNEVNGLRK